MLPRRRPFALTTLAALLGVAAPVPAQVGRTEITKWPQGKRGAVSLTYDDGSANQFRVAVPIMDRFGFPATFFIVTGEIAGSRYRGTFVGRPPETIVQETASVPTGAANVLERASAIRFLGRGTLDFHTRAGEILDEGGSPEKAYLLLDEAYARVRAGAFPPPGRDEGPGAGALGWDDVAALASRGYEFASHTVTHPRLAALDEPNLVYELEKSRQEILDHLGDEHTFSVECPYGTENDRVMEKALARYPLARNRMPDPFVEDLARWNDKSPSLSTKDYVRWQRGPLTGTPMSLMKSWVDVAAASDNVWLVLVFHGVDGIGWEPRTGADLREYFAYLKSKEHALWVATFQDVAKYMRERERATVSTSVSGDAITVVLRADLEDPRYDVPLTLETLVPPDWKIAEVRQGARFQRVSVVKNDGKSHVLYAAIPNAEDVRIARASPAPR